MSLKRDSMVLFASEGASALLTIVTGFAIARFLPVEDFGRFMAAFAFAGLLSVAADSGMGLLAAKDAARGETAGRRLRELFTWRLAMIIAACAAGLLLAPLALPAGDARTIGAWLTPGVMLVGLVDFFGWVLKGRRHVGWSAALQVGTRVLLLVLCVTAIVERRTLAALLAAFWLTGAAVLAMGPAVLARAGVNVRPIRLRRAFFTHTLPDVYKIGVVIVLSVAFTRLDLLLVTGLCGAAAAGLFGAAGRVIDALRMVPTVANSVLLPRFSAARDDAPLFRRHFRSAFRSLLLLGVALAAVSTLAAEPIVVRLLGEPYRGAADLLRPLVWSIVPMFLNMLGFSALYALHDHRTLVWGISAALVVELGINALTLPRFGAQAACWSRLAAEWVNFLVLSRALTRRGLMTLGAPSHAADLAPAAGWSARS